jgi:phospholipid-binding lipoprotein MlaA
MQPLGATRRTQYKENSMSTSGLHNIGLILLLAVLSGCASVPGEYRDPRDPLESYNRGMFKFNKAVDDAVVKPVAKGYKAVTPAVLDRGITNFFNNIADVTSAVNNLLQFKLARAGSDVGRLAVNTTLRDTIGLGGDIVTSPLFNLRDDHVYWGLVGLNYINRRADLLAAGEILEEAAIDPYIFVRDAYLQRRRDQIFDGNPPPDLEPDAEDIWVE